MYSANSPTGCISYLFITKENQDRVPTLYWLTKFHKNPIKQDVLLILVLVRQQNFRNCKPHVLQLLIHVMKYCEKVYERSVKNLFWSIKNSGEIMYLII